MDFFSIIVFVFIAVIAFAGVFMKEKTAYLLMLFGFALWFAALQGAFSQQTTTYIAGAYLVGIIILRLIVIRFPQKATALNMGMAKVFDKIFHFLTGRTLTDRLLQMKELGERNK